MTLEKNFKDPGNASKHPEIQLKIFDFLTAVCKNAGKIGKSRDFVPRLAAQSIIHSNG